MLDKGNLYTGELKGTPLGDFWLAASEQGLAAIEWGKNSTQFEAYLTRRFKRATVYNPEIVKEAVKEYAALLPASLVPQVVMGINLVAVPPLAGDEIRAADPS